jgi:hypothetical protein
MNENQIRDYFAPNWVFRLFNSVNFVVAIVGIPLAIFLTGAVVASILGALETFRCNLLAYPVGVAMALAAYGWFAHNFPKYLERVYPALDTTPEEFGGIIKKWSDQLGNRLSLFILAGLVIGFLNFQNLGQLWQPQGWLGDVWASSVQWGTFFKWYYGVIDVVIGGFLLGSGAIGVVGIVLVVHSLMKLPLKLSHYRNLEAIGDLSIGLTVWTLVGLAFIGPVRAVSAPNVLCQSNVVVAVDPARLLSNLIVSMFSSIAVVSGLCLPAFFAHQAVVRAKARQIASLVDTQHDIYSAIDQLCQKLKAETPSQPTPDHNVRSYKQALDEFSQAYERIQIINKMIADLEAVPDWPISWRGGVKIAVAAVSPLATNLFVRLAPDLAKALGIKP